MIVYPALDLRHGQVVRLRYGDPSQQTIYSNDPLATAKRWKAVGAEWLHVVNLDGALGEADQNLSVLRKLTGSGLRLQVGGGLRSPYDIDRAFKMGAERVVIGTLAIENPKLIGHLVRSIYSPGAVVVALDAREGKIMTHGWQGETAWTPIEMGRRFADLGLCHALFTDVTRDGSMAGLNIEATKQLAAATGLSLIASGGVASLDDLRALREVMPAISGVVIGKALYDGIFTLDEALRTVQGIQDAG